MKCTQCGAQVDGDFCPYCGAAPETKTADNPLEQPNIATNNTIGKVNNPKKPVHKKWWFWVVVAVIVIGIIGNLGGNNSQKVNIEKFEWENIALSEVLPEPPSNKGSNLMNTEQYLSIDIHDVSKSDYKDYVDACRDKGFTVDLNETGDFYSASNKTGYKIMLCYYDDDEKLSINLTAPSDEKKAQKYQIDYADAATFEKALNDGEKVNGKIVQFDVIEYKPDSALGINCWSGEHLNFISDEELDVRKGDVVFGRVTKEPTKALGSWRIPYEVLSVGDQIESPDTRSEKAGFDSKKNEVYQVAGYTVEIPKYWKSENKIDSGIQRYAEKGGKVAMLQVTAQKETDDGYAVTFDGLMSDNDNMIEMIESTAFTKVTDYEVIDTGTVKGILYKGTIENMSEGLSGCGAWFAFASETDRNWCTLVMCQSDNTEFVYNEDFMKIIKSLKPAKKQETAAEEKKPEPAKPVSEYEKAYIRDMSSYDLYYMFDTDTKKVVYFGTNDTYIEKGTYTGDFATGITINWNHGEWTEKLTHSSGNIATLIDGNGFDWEYKVCDIAVAQKELDKLK